MCFQKKKNDAINVRLFQISDPRDFPLSCVHYPTLFFVTEAFVSLSVSRYQVKASFQTSRTDAVGFTTDFKWIRLDTIASKSCRTVSGTATNS